MRKNLQNALSRHYGFKKVLCLFLLMGFCLASFAQQLSGNYTINSKAATAGRNFESFGDAVYALESGVSGPVVIEVVAGSGPYTDQVTINAIPGASKTNTVTIKGNGETLQFLSTSEINSSGIKLDGAKYVTIDGVVIHCLASDVDYEYGTGISLMRNSDFNVIKNCTIKNLETTKIPQKTAGIVIKGFEVVGTGQNENFSDSNVIEGNTIIGGYEGIIIDGYSNLADETSFVFGNQVLNNTIRNVQQCAIKILWNDGTIIRGNKISTKIHSMTSFFGMWVMESNANLMIDGNTFHDFTLNGIPEYTGSRCGISFGNTRTPVGSENYIINNVFYNITNAYDETRAIELTSSSNGVYIYHNTISLDNIAEGASKNIRGLYIENTGSTNVKFMNNIITMGSVTSVSKIGIHLNAVPADFISNNNNIYLQGPGGGIGNYAGATYNTVGAWNRATGYDAHSISFWPKYINIATGDLKPDNELMDNYAKYVNVAKDYTGASRPNTFPDLGAYEFLSAPCSTPPVGGKVVASPFASTCAGGAVVLNLADNSTGDGQTFQWQTSATANGTFTDLGDTSKIPLKDIIANQTLYYRCELICNDVVAYSDTFVIVAHKDMPGGTYTINNTLPTSATNFNSFEDALGVLKCGIAGPIVFNVAKTATPYTEQLIISAIPGASSTNTITFNGNGATLQFNPRTTGQRAIIKLNGASHFTFYNFELRGLSGNGAGGYGYGVQFINNADSNVIRKNTILVDTIGTNGNFAGIVMSANQTNPVGTTGETNLSDYNVIDSNFINGGMYGVVIASAVEPNHVKGNKITNNTIDNFYQYGIYLAGTDATLVEGNDISRSTRTKLETFNGIYAATKNTNMLVSKNKIHDPAANYPAAFGMNGIYFNNADGEAAKPNIVVNNTIYNIVLQGGIYGLYNTGSDHAYYYHNTVVFDDTTYAGSSATRGIYQTTTATGLKFINNNIYVTRGGSATANFHAIYLNATGTTYEANYNNYFVGSPTAITNVGYYPSTNYKTLANWKTITKKEANSLSIDPKFRAGTVIPTASDLSKQGTYVNVDTDIDNVTRSKTTPDIGAYEFTELLPVTIVNFSAAKNGEDVIVKWQAANEQNFKQYEVERSANGTDFTTVGTVKAIGGSYYSFNDYAAFTNVSTLHYRLKLVDIDGTVNYTHVVKLTQQNTGNTNVAVYPNPFTNQLFATVNAAVAGDATATITNASGAKMSVEKVAVNRGSQILRLQVKPDLPSGVYIVTLQLHGEVYHFKLIKQ
ncbi:right-handed parallel beta-helix repeat-containing protein [Polluticaenibacter yanchengensis]|uniref:Right-handed parallel beta-helix repeat-containing protein n=1 Tax=Polluticaenibacter yanchengensis TaxID=3014562 RepID=A0ABT4UGI8_9BACT|nr:right-handed parallel beta-helix repeat-containing protein [Chitinophagaceae bacterium LY-5]